jgi:S-methylmethionine-dependent homocysteine/selenocysteine methylase
MTTQLPLKPERIYLTDGGLETTLIFHHGMDLPCFAAFDLMKDKAGRDTLCAYYRRYADLAVKSDCGFIFETPTWRANRDWGAELGYSPDQLEDVNRDAVKLMSSIRKEYENNDSPMVISGNIGPRGDGYVVDNLMSKEQARDYHQHQIDAFARAGTDLVTAITMTYVEEAIGVVLAAQRAGQPSVIGFTTETDGRLPSGSSLEEARVSSESYASGFTAAFLTCSFSAAAAAPTIVIWTLRASPYVDSVGYGTGVGVCRNGARPP